MDDGIEQKTVSHDVGLRRQLGLGTATALVVGEVIGVGIFLTPAGMARALGSPALLIVVWLVMGLVTLAGALCFGALAARSPEAGGGYAFLRDAYGPLPAFLYGWMSMLVTDPGLTALLAVGMGEALAGPLGLTPAAVKGLAVATIVALAAVNVVGVAPGARLLAGLTALKLGMLAFVAVWGVGLGRGDWSNLTPLLARRPDSGPIVPALTGALVSAFFSFAGWWDSGKLAGEVRDPETTLPRALAIGTGVVTAVYILVSVVFFYLVPTARITSDRAFAALAGEALFGPAGGAAFALIAATSVLGSLSAFVMAAPRVYYAMARDGVFFPSVARLAPRFGTPARAVAIQAVLASALVITGTFEQILAYFFFVTVAFLWLTVAGVYVLGRRGEAVMTRLPGYPVTPLVFLVPISALLALLAVSHPRQTCLGLGVVALGVPMYWVAFRRGAAVESTSTRPDLT